MYTRQLYCTVKGFMTESFTAQQEALLHSRKVSLAAETGEKFLLRQKLEKSSILRQKLEKSFFCSRTEDKHHVLPVVSVLLADES